MTLKGICCTLETVLAGANVYSRKLALLCPGSVVQGPLSPVLKHKVPSPASRQRVASTSSPSWPRRLKVCSETLLSQGCLFLVRTGTAFGRNTGAAQVPRWLVAVNNKADYSVSTAPRPGAKPPRQKSGSLDGAKLKEWLEKQYQDEPLRQSSLHQVCFGHFNVLRQALAGTCQTPA